MSESCHTYDHSAYHRCGGWKRRVCERDKETRMNGPWHVSWRRHVTGECVTRENETCDTWLDRVTRTNGSFQLAMTLVKHMWMSYNTLQHTASHSNTLQHTLNELWHLSNICKWAITHCNTLQHTATHCNTLQHAATHCNTLQHTARHCNTLQHTVTHCNTLQHTTTHCNTLQHTARHCKTLPHSATNNMQTSRRRKQTEISLDHVLQCIAVMARYRLIIAHSHVSHTSYSSFTHVSNSS